MKEHDWLSLNATGVRGQYRRWLCAGCSAYMVIDVGTIVQSPTGELTAEWAAECSKMVSDCDLIQVAKILRE